MFVTSVALFCLLGTQWQIEAKNVQFHNCKSIFTVHSVDVDPCDSGPGDTFCPLKKGSQSRISFNFTATKDAEKLLSKVQGIMGGMAAPFPLKNPDACKDSGLECPLVEGKTYSYSHMVDVLSAYPKVSALIRWMLFEKTGAEEEASDNQKLVCIVVKAKIVD